MSESGRPGDNDEDLPASVGSPQPASVDNADDFPTLSSPAGGDSVIVNADDSAAGDMGEGDDDDEDNWSRQVETDLPPQTAASESEGGGGMSVSSSNGGTPPVPRREEPTLKEKLVERERQRRVETERARWKRQFAMTAHSEGDETEQVSNDVRTATQNGQSSGESHQQEHLRETNSVAGTVGEDTVAGRLDTLDDDESTKMNYPMERFLRETVDTDQISAANQSKEIPNREANPTQGVLMARFLQGVPSPTNQTSVTSVPGALTSPGQSVNRSVSFDRESPMMPTDNRTSENSGRGQNSDLNQSPALLNMSTASSSFREDEIIDQAPITLGLAPSAAGSVANVSTVCMPPSEDDHSETEVVRPDELLPRPLASDGAAQIDIGHAASATETMVIDDVEPAQSTDMSMEPESPSQPRVVLRLTEAEIQEMAAIDEASRSNAPPSERDDISELGELVSDFGGPVIVDGLGAATMSQGTPTTEAMESASSIANHSGVVTGNMSTSDHGGTDGQHITDPLGTASVSSQVVSSSVGGDISLAGNPPSESGRGHDDVEQHSDSQMHMTTPITPVPREIVPSHPPQGLMSTSTTDVSMPDLPIPTSIGPDHIEEEIVNRKIRPGLVNTNLSHSPQSPLKKAASFPHVEHIDDFDFDKNNPSETHLQLDGVGNRLDRDERWSSGLSPMTPVRVETDVHVNSSSLLPDLQDYGTIDHDAATQRQKSGSKTQPDQESSGFAIYRSEEDGEDHTPLLEDGVPTVVAARRRSAMNSLTSIKTMSDMNSVAESVFSDIRSESTATRHSISNEAENYWKSSTLERAFPERLFALTVTLLFEIPVLLMVSGGSDRLCYLIGRTKYQLLIGFLPLSSAISGNVGLQSSTLTTRAISHGQVKVQNYSRWLRKEIGAAAYLGLGMGTLLGAIAFFASGFSVPFGLTVMIAQFISILTAGITGTFAPLIFTFIFERDSGKWGGPLETAIQDIVGSFAMVVISYQILVLFAPFDVSPDDQCGTMN